MNKGELIEAIAKATKASKADAQRTLEATLGAIIKGAKKDGAVQLVGFGSFKKVKTKARKGVNPATGEKIKIPAKTTIKFKISKNLKY